jgi:hypothetical protein
MRQAKTDIPGLILKGRVAFMPADLDRRYNRDNLPDHANLLANLVRWAAVDSIPLEVETKGRFDCNLYTQPGRVIAHFVNLTATGRIPIDELIPVGPVTIRLKLPRDVRGRTVKALVSNARSAGTVRDGVLAVNIPSITDHEVLVIE